MAVKKDILTRAFISQFETREENDIGIVTGRPIVFNQRVDIGWFDEIIEPGALLGTDLKDVRLCLNHDTSFVYARSRNNNANSTMRIFVDDSGLGFEASLDIKNSPKAQDFYTAIKRGDIDKMSFMFAVRNESWENLESDHPLRRITDIEQVLEISLVTFPAYDQTSIQARDQQVLDNARAALDNARSTPDGAKLALEKLKATVLFKI